MTTSVQRSPPIGISVLVCGAGVGGLMTALECWRVGCDVRVFDKQKETSTQGDSFTIGPSATNAFRNWPEMMARHDEIAYDPLLAICDISGKRLRPPFKVSDMTPLANGKTIVRHMRPEFHAMLTEQLGKIGIEVQSDRRVVEYFEDTKQSCAGVVLADGSRHEADVVVAADGIHSPSWKVVSNKPVAAKSSGHSVFRVAYPIELALSDPLVAERFTYDAETGKSVVEMLSGPETMCIVWRNDKYLTWAIEHPDLTSTSTESWSARISPSVALAYASTLPNFSPALAAAIALTPPDALTDWKLVLRDPQPTWTSPAGHIIQLGDAAHTFLPASGNGGTQALEDAVSLAACLSLALAHSTSASRIPDATRVHNRLRFTRTSFIQAMGVGHRALRTRSVARGGSSRPLKIGAWLLDHDPAAYARERFEEALRVVRGEVGDSEFEDRNGPPGIEYVPWTFEGLERAVESGEASLLDGGWF